MIGDVLVALAVAVGAGTVAGAAGAAVVSARGARSGPIESAAGVLLLALAVGICVFAWMLI